MIELFNMIYSNTVEMRQNGRFIEFYKRNSPNMYKIDLSRNGIVIKEKRSTGEIEPCNDDGTCKNYFKAKIVTNDDKMANMFRYAQYISDEDDIYSILYKFRSSAMHTFEKWLSLGTKFKQRSWGWGNQHRNECHTQTIEYDPSAVSSEMRKYITSKRWEINDLNKFINDFITEIDTEDHDIANKIFKELIDNPEYQDDFIIVNGFNRYVNRLDGSFINSLISIIKAYNMQVPRLMWYMHYLHDVEFVEMPSAMRDYRIYLRHELERNNGKKNKMYKFPVHFQSTLHRDRMSFARQEALEHFEPDEDYLYENEYLEYENDKFKFIIPRSAHDVHEEARQQGHCLETRFLNYVAAGDTGVVFMRSKEDLTKALITIEVRNRRVRQMCIGNNNPVPDYYRDDIREWAREVRVAIDSRSWSTMLDVDL